MLKVLKKIQSYYLYDSIVLATSSGTIYLGNDDISKEKVFIQVVTKLRFANKSSDSVANFALQLNFLKETLCLFWLRFLDFIETAHSFYIIVEAPKNFCSLRERILKSGPIIKDEKEVFCIFLQLIKGYSPFCSRNQPHLNIKTKAIYLCNDDKTNKPFYKISPFFQYNHFETLQEEMLDYSHLPPEIINKKSFSSKSDMWSIGLVLYEMVFGMNPFESDIKEKVLKQIEYFFEDKNKLFPPKFKFSDDCASFLLCLLEPNIEKRINWKDLFKHKFVLNNSLALKSTLINQIKMVYESYSSNPNIPPDILEAINALKQDINSSIKQLNIYKKIESSGEFELFESLKDYKLLNECKDFYLMKIFDDEIKFHEISNILNKEIKNLSPNKRKSLFVNLNTKIPNENDSMTSLLRRGKIASDFNKTEIIPSNSIKTFIQAKKSMTAKHFYQRELVKQFKMYLELLRKFASEIETLFMQYSISKLTYFRFQYFKDRLMKGVNIFDLPFWEELKLTADFTNMVQNIGDLFAKDHSETYYALQQYRENNKTYMSLNYSETFFIQFTNSLNQQVFMETDFISGFQSFAIRFLEDLVNKANNEFGKNKKNSTKYYQLALRTIEIIDFSRNYGISKFDKEAVFDLDEIGQKIDSLNLDSLWEETNSKMKNLIKK